MKILLDSGYTTMTIFLFIFSWRLLIKSYCTWSLELRHQNQASDLDRSCMNIMRVTRRKFSTIKLFHLGAIRMNKLFEIFQRHGVNVVKLELQRCVIKYFRFADLLKCMPNLKHVFVSDTFGESKFVASPPEQMLPELKQLHTLEIVDSACSIIEFFSRSKVYTARFSHQQCNRSMRCSLKDFLKSQNMLTSLTMESLSYLDMSTLFGDINGTDPMPFQLTKLSATNIRVAGILPDDLLQFLTSQAQNLKEFEVGLNSPIILLEFAMAEMTNLETLNLTSYVLPKEREFYDQLNENPSVTNLMVLAFHNIFDHANIFNKLPNINSLFLDGYSTPRTLLTVQREQLQHLETLQIRYLMGKIDCTVENKLMSS